MGSGMRHASTAARCRPTAEAQLILGVRQEFGYGAVRERKASPLVGGIVEGERCLQSRLGGPARCAAARGWGVSVSTVTLCKVIN